MTKKEREHLHSTKCVVEGTDFQSGRGLETRFIVSMSLTGGELMALRTALDNIACGTVAFNLHHIHDVYAYLRNALARAEIK